VAVQAGSCDQSGRVAACMPTPSCLRFVLLVLTKARGRGHVVRCAGEACTEMVCVAAVDLARCMLDHHVVLEIDHRLPLRDATVLAHADPCGQAVDLVAARLTRWPRVRGKGVGAGGGQLLGPGTDSQHCPFISSGWRFHR